MILTSDHLHLFLYLHHPHLPLRVPHKLDYLHCLQCDHFPIKQYSFCVSAKGRHTRHGRLNFRCG